MERARDLLNAKSRVEIRRANERFVTQTDWLLSYHSFSFGPHYDLNNTRHGLLVVNNEDIVKPMRGFATHAHRDMEIVTWVLEGELEHRDSTGRCGVIYPGLVQRMSAGRGISHSEMNPSDRDPVHFVQMWILPDRKGIEPNYEQCDVSSELKQGRLIPVASGKKGRGAISLAQRGATLWVGRLAPNSSVTIPEAPFVHLFVAAGTIQLDGRFSLLAGDAARLTSAESLSARTGEQGAEILVWEMHP